MGEGGKPRQQVEQERERERECEQQQENGQQQRLRLPLQPIRGCFALVTSFHLTDCLFGCLSDWSATKLDGKQTR